MWFILVLVVAYVGYGMIKLNNNKKEHEKLLEESRVHVNRIKKERREQAARQTAYTEEELLRIAKKETGLIISRIEEIKKSDIEYREFEYDELRRKILARKYEPIGNLLQATYNTYTDDDRDSAKFIHTDD
jgi:hypothetical protein